MYIIGYKEGKPFEIAASCDDIAWIVPATENWELRNDMFYPSGAIRYWSDKYQFRVGRSLSSVNIELIKK